MKLEELRIGMLVTYHHTQRDGKPKIVIPSIVDRLTSHMVYIKFKDKLGNEREKCVDAKYLVPVK